ncbi:MAG TPA: hypothetical protein VFQ35_13995, partial [Polyangiaceae bacterium]|nr:hypothetical protein [Polyangiaceae bacterium]
MRRVRLVTLLFFAFATRRAHATEPAPALKGEAPLPLELEWKAPPECPKADDIHAELSRIARVRPGRVPPTVVARVRIDKRSGRYHLVLKTTRDGEVGKRNLSAAECGALGREVTLVLALTFGDGVALASEGEDEPPTADAGNSSAPVETKPEAPPKPLPVAPPSARAEAASPPAAPVTSLERTPRVAAFAGGGVLLRALPRLAARISLGAEVGSRKFWLAPELSVVLPSHDSLARGVSARYDAAGGALAGCSALAESPRVAA